MHVAPESQQARQQFKAWYENYWNWVQDLIQNYTPHADVLPFNYEELVAGLALVGSPAELVERIETTTERLGLERMIFMSDLGGIPDETLFATLELFGSEVMPKLGSK
jgi:alkanesulfonate monooxygenase SsuD/methylene tetrahydromethanopterin reductase-like flavin-dependent oxidoreductase (luciferase family)